MADYSSQPLLPPVAEDELSCVTATATNVTEQQRKLLEINMATLEAELQAQDPGIKKSVGDAATKLVIAHDTLEVGGKRALLGHIQSLETPRHQKRNWKCLFGYLNELVLPDLEDGATAYSEEEQLTSDAAEIAKEALEIMTVDASKFLYSAVNRNVLRRFGNVTIEQGQDQQDGISSITADNHSVTDTAALTERLLKRGSDSA